MALTLTIFPNQWQAVHLPLRYQFDFNLVVDSGQAYAAGSATNQGGYLAMTIFASNLLQAGDRFFIASGTSPDLYQQSATTIIDVIKSGSTYYVVFDIAYDAAVSVVYAYKPAYIQGLMPKFQLYINDVSKGFLRYTLREGHIKIDVREELKAAFERVFAPELGIDANYFKKYRLDYTNSFGTVLTGTDRYVINAVIQPQATNNLPDWQFDMDSLRCRMVDGDNTGEQEAQMRDVNICSPTYTNIRGGDVYYVTGINTTTCPIPAGGPTPPDPSLVFQYNVNAIQASSAASCSIGDAGTLDSFFTLDNPIIVGTLVYGNILFSLPKPDGFYHRLGFNFVYHVVSGQVTEIISC